VNKEALKLINCDPNNYILNFVAHIVIVLNEKLQISWCVWILHHIAAHFENLQEGSCKMIFKNKCFGNRLTII